MIDKRVIWQQRAAKADEYEKTMRSIYRYIRRANKESNASILVMFGTIVDKLEAVYPSRRR